MFHVSSRSRGAASAARHAEKPASSATISVRVLRTPGEIDHAVERAAAAERRVAAAATEAASRRLARYATLKEPEG